MDSASKLLLCKYIPKKSTINTSKPAVVKQAYVTTAFFPCSSLA